MKFLTDENVDIRVFNGLKKSGFDVKSILKEGKQGLKDKEVLDFSVKDKRILITHDKDFENHPSYKNIKHEGIILLRFKDQSYPSVLKFLLQFLNSKKAEKLSGKLIVISEVNIRLYKKKTS